MKRYKFLIIGLAAVTLTGCKSLYGKYERPQVKTSGLVRDAVNDNDTLAVTDTTSFANLPWRSVFTDPQLQQLIEKTLANNPDLLNAALNVEMAEAQLKAAKLSFLPGFTFSPQGTIASWDGMKATKTYSLPINASWDANLFGNLTAAKRASQVSMLQAKDYQVAVQTKLIANVANMYYTLLMLDKQLQIVNDMEKLTKDTWEIMKVQQQAVRGVRSTAVQSAESNYLSVQTQKEDLKRQIRETENSLSLLAGQQARSIPRSSLDVQSLPASFSTGVGIQLLANRADVHANEMALANCFYNVEAARARFYPSLTISASGAFTNSGGMGIVNPGKFLLSAVGALTQPIFMKGQLTAGLRVAEARYKQAYNTWQNSVLSAGLEVSNALVLYNASDAKSKLEAQRIKVLTQNVEDTRSLMASAGSTYLEVITAESNLLNSQLSQVQDDFSKMQAVVNLYYALGGGAK
ncbi:efflux transporter outer membrane subunit [Hallella multisaccharivorax]|uniref:efflux transporter outer membrane subunit n=1 Tax=Hallella multisaccharivorax TaxID=310514 RepID=UPI003611992A